MSDEEIECELTKNLRANMEEQQKNLNQVLMFKSNLSSALLNDIINEDDYSYMKTDYVKKFQRWKMTLN